MTLKKLRYMVSKPDLLLGGYTDMCVNVDVRPRVCIGCQVGSCPASSFPQRGMTAISEASLYVRPWACFGPGAGLGFHQ